MAGQGGNGGFMVGDPGIEVGNGGSNEIGGSIKKSFAEFVGIEGGVRIPDSFVGILLLSQLQFPFSGGVAESDAGDCGSSKRSGSNVSKSDQVNLQFFECIETAFQVTQCAEEYVLAGGAQDVPQVAELVVVLGGS